MPYKKCGDLYGNLVREGCAVGIDRIHPIIALWRTIGKGKMSVREFKEWYQSENPEDRLGLAKLAAEELGCELDEETDSRSDTEQ